MKRAAQKGDMSADWLTAGKSAYRLVDHSLKNGSGEILFGGSFINKGLNVGFGKYTASGGYGVQGFVVFGILIKPCRISLKQRGHLINKRTGTACADTVHSLLHIPVFEVNDFGILAAQLDGNIRLRGQILKGGGYSDNFLDKRHAKMVGQRKPAGSGNHGMKGNIS